MNATPIASSDREAANAQGLRRAIYAILILTAVGGMVGRIWTVRSDLGKTPLLSANDRSRWCTVRALVDHGTYAIDDVIRKGGVRGRRDREWFTIDMVRHKGPDGLEHFYSSKPPLLPTMVAWVYWGIQRWNGVTLAERPFYVVRFILMIVNVIPLAIYLWLLSRMAERYASHPWSRVFVVAAACYGTFLTTFAVTLNNHLPAAVSVMIALYVALPVWRDEANNGYRYALAGLFAAFAAANEMPALSFLALMGISLFVKSPVRTLLGFVPAAAVVAGAFFQTNWNAHGSWRPPYAHRTDGPVVAAADGDFTATLQSGKVPAPLAEALAAADVQLSPLTLVKPRLSGEGWYLWDRDGQDRLALSADAAGVEARVWDQWYEYDGEFGVSYWFSERKQGVDLGEESRLAYAFHMLLGHHGLFPLTPIWLLSVAGIAIWMVRREDRMQGVGLMFLGLSLLILAFYIARPLKDRNYGGVCCGLRWIFWLIPLWTLALLPACDWIAQRRGLRYLALGLLLGSAISSAYASLNPWTHPWIYAYWQYLEWVPGVK